MAGIPNIPDIGNPYGAFGQAVTNVGEILDPTTQHSIATASVYDLSSYGLIPNSTTSLSGLSNLAAVRQAMSDVPEGSILLFPVPVSGGYYYIENDGVSALTPTKVVTFAGPMGAGVKLKFGPNDPSTSVQMFLTTAGKNVTFADLWIEGPDSNANNVAAIYCVKNNPDITTSNPDGGAGITTFIRCWITKFSHCVKNQGDGVTISTNRRIRCLDSYFLSTGNSGNICVNFLTDGGEVFARGSTFEVQKAGMNGGNINTASHNMYLNPGTSLDVSSSNFLDAPGYHINANNPPSGTPKWWRVCDNYFAGSNPTGSIHTNPWVVGIPGVDSAVSLISGNTFADSSAGSGITVDGNCHIVGNDFSGLASGSGSAIATFSANTQGTSLIEGNRFRSRIRVICPFVTWFVKGNTFTPNLAASGPCITTTPAATGTPGSLIEADSNVFIGSGGNSTQVTIQGGTFRSRQNHYINKNNSTQQLAITGSPTGGTFTLTFGGQTTAGIAYNADSNAVQSALVALSSIGAGNVQVVPVRPTSTNTGVLPGCPMQIMFVNSLGGAAQSTITTDATGLTGGTTPAVGVTSVVTGGSVTTAAILVQTSGVIDGGADQVDDTTWDSFEDTSKALSIVTPATGTYKVDRPRVFGSNISSAATITVPFGVGIVHITGTSTINTINNPTAATMVGTIGSQIRLIFDSTAALGTSGNIANAFSGTAGVNKVITWDGTKWQG